MVVSLILALMMKFIKIEIIIELRNALPVPNTTIN